MMLHYIFLLGISVEAISGAIAAGRKRMDFFGVILIGSVTGLGGGTVRDIVFNTHPIPWVEHPYYLIYTASFALLTICIPARLTRAAKLFLVLDGLGLAAFTVLGTQKLLTHDLSAPVAILGGMLTGISGGMLRDILCNDIPVVLRSELYAVIALCGAILYATLLHFGANTHFCAIVTVITIFTARLIAIWFHVEVPKFNYEASLQDRKSRWRRR